MKLFFYSFPKHFLHSLSYWMDVNAFWSATASLLNTITIPCSIAKHLCSLRVKFLFRLVRYWNTKSEARQWEEAWRRLEQVGKPGASIFPFPSHRAVCSSTALSSSCLQPNRSCLLGLPVAVSHRSASSVGKASSHLKSIQEADGILSNPGTAGEKSSHHPHMQSMATTEHRGLYPAELALSASACFWVISCCFGCFFNTLPPVLPHAIHSPHADGKPPPTLSS